MPVRYPRIIGVLASLKSAENPVIHPAEICEVLLGQEEDPKKSCWTVPLCDVRKGVCQAWSSVTHSLSPACKLYLSPAQENNVHIEAKETILEYVDMTRFMNNNNERLAEEEGR